MNKDHLLDNIKRIHFIGIGGSGMCPLAEILHSEGFILSGSDCNEGETLDRIRSYGIPVHMGHKAENIEGAELIVYTAAVKKDNPELVAAEEKGIPAIERSVMLGIVTRRYNRSIAIAGTHGKTSTTAMLSQLLIGAGFDPSAIIGGKLPYLGGNSYVGQSDIIVCEACEYVDTFLELTPYISVITNIDADHLDYFKTLDNIKKSFNKFCHLTTGLIVYNGDDENILDAIEDVELPMITFGFRKTNDYYAANLRDVKGAYKTFDLMHKGEKLCEIDLMVPGRHNIYNALAAITVADDFAHHPTELTATLSSAMEMGFRKVWAVFQPHTFSRTALLLDDFAKALSIPDVAIISEILPVRETNTYNIYNTDLGAKVEGSVCIDTFEDITKYIVENAQEDDLVITLGGGNVYMCANMILKALQKEED